MACNESYPGHADKPSKAGVSSHTFQEEQTAQSRTLTSSSGSDPSKIFHKKVNKRLIPEYYQIITEPVAISTLRKKTASKEYTTIAEFVRDCALIWHNAHTFNRPTAGAYTDATILKGLFETEFQSLVDQNVIPAEAAVWPELGEIPPVDDSPPEAEGQDEDEDEEEEDEEEEEEDDEENKGKKRKRGNTIGAAVAKREGASKDDGQSTGDMGAQRKRGRPPKVDTPMEARIKSVLKAIRKPKNGMGQIMIHHFEKLPDKTVMPEYYLEIKEPLAIEQIKVSALLAHESKQPVTLKQRKQKRKKYRSVDDFMKDIDTMFENAKAYNEDESQIFKDAIFLQVSCECNNLSMCFSHLTP